jgi:transcriptional regulator with XRE-family HTH domain
MVEDRQSDFGGLLRRHRLRALLTQEQLAERAGMSPRAVGGLERGTVHSPRGSSVQLLADALALTGATRDAFVAAGRGDGSRLGGPATAAARSGAASAGAETSPPAAGPGWPAGPFLLPPDIADFTGRADVVDLLCDLLAKVTEGTAEPTAVAVGAVAGKAGVGKTTLAVHVAHRLRDRFPDGQLYAELGGVHSHPLDPSRVLGWFLRALGIEGGAIPETLEERAGLYRGLLAGRRVLVVLDDAGYGAQVRPLLPGSPSCAVLVTSRSRLAELAGARLIELDVLDPQQAITLLGTVAGQQRVAAESDAAAAIAVACGRLPLALRVAGARLAARPHWRLTRLAGRLADERRRLDELALGDLEVRASVGLSYDGLEGEQRRAFRLLGLLEASTFAAWVAAALLDVEAGQGEELVEALVDAQLLEVAAGSPAGHGRYRFHDLVQLRVSFWHMMGSSAKQHEEPLPCRPSRRW